MNFFKQAQIEADADDLEEDVRKAFGKFGVDIRTKSPQIIGCQIVIPIKTKGNTREAHVRANAPEVQRILKLPLLHVVKLDFNLFLIASRKSIIYDRLLTILNTSAYRETCKQVQLPYIVGHDVLGGVVMEDLAQFPHLLLGGSTSSGKSVGLQALITSVAYNKSPSQVNFVLKSLLAHCCR